MSEDRVRDYAESLDLTVEELFDELDEMSEDEDVGLPGQQEEA